MKNTEAELFEQLQLFRVLIENIPNPIFLKDISGEFLGYNKAFQDFYGLRNGDYIGKTVFDLPISQQEALLHHKADLELLQSPGSKTYRASVTFPDGSVRHTISKKATFARADGTIAGIVGVITDITDLKKAEEALRYSEARFRDLSEASSEAVIFIQKGIVTDVNRRMYDMFGYEDGEVIGRNVLDFIASALRDKTREKMLSHNEEMYETTGLKKNGAMFPVEVRPRELHLRGKHMRITAVRDLTQQKRMEEEVLKAKNMQSIGMLAGGIAHDFNNLLMAIVGNISLARMHASKDSKAVELLAEAERIAFMGKNLTHQLLMFSRGGDPVRKILSVGPMLQEITEQVIAGSPVKANYTIAEDLSFVEIDEDQIRQVIQNMITNAREAMESGGTIYIECGNAKITPHDKLPLIKEDYVKISIRDEGNGMPEEHLSKIFDPYFTTKGMGSKKGVGLGLAICYSIVRKHNGYITVDSVPGEGTTFHIYFPVHKSETVEETEESRNARMDKGRVLIMDDEEMILKIARELLQHMGYEVTTALNGEEAIHLYRQAMELKKPFDAVILDLAIPGSIGGKEVMAELVLIDPYVKAIISSGYLNDPIIVESKSYGFSGILTKPYDAEELDGKLRSIIHGAS